MSINRVTITGNLTRDPELRALPSGSSVLSFGVAVNDRWRNPQTQQWEDRPNYIDCVMFGNRAQSLANILHRGMKVAIEGKLRWSQWQDRESGKNRSKIEVVVDEVEFMSTRDQQGSQGSYPQGQQNSYPATPQVSAPQNQNFSAATPAPAPVQTPPSGDVYDKDIPF